MPHPTPWTVQKAQNWTIKDWRSHINTIRAWLGHVSISTTNIYAEIESGLVDYLTRHGLASIRDLVGTIKYPR